MDRFLKVDRAEAADSFLKKKAADPQNMKYMSTVDEAMNQRGHPYAFICSLAVLVFFMFFFLWASVAELDEVTRGEGKVIPASGAHPVQSERGGTIDRILVKEGSQVVEGEVVAILSNVQEAATLRDLQNKNIELTLAIIRLEAESLSADLFFPPDIEKRYPEAVRAQKSIYNARKQQFLGENIQLEAQIEQRSGEVAEMTERRNLFQGTLELLRQEERTVKPLVGRSYTQIQYLDLQERIVTQEGELAGAIQAIAQAQNGVHAAEERRNTRHAERQSSIAEELNANRIEQAAIQERMKVSTDHVSNAELRSPIAGTINFVALKEGEITTPAEVIMEIVPADDVLEILAKFHPKDRGFLFVSQGAVVKFSGYDFSIYGGMDAIITRISEDTIEDKRGDPWFEIRFVTKQKNLMYQGRALEIHPGMPVSIDVLTAKRTVLEIISRPLLRAKDNAMTER